MLAWSILAVAVAIIYHADRNNRTIMDMQRMQESHQRETQIRQHELEKQFAKEQHRLFKESQSVAK